MYNNILCNQQLQLIFMHLISFIISPSLLLCHRYPSHFFFPTSMPNSLERLLLSIRACSPPLLMACLVKCQATNKHFQPLITRQRNNSVLFSVAKYKSALAEALSLSVTAAPHPPCFW